MTGGLLKSLIKSTARPLHGIFLAREKHTLMNVHSGLRAFVSFHNLIHHNWFQYDRLKAQKHWLTHPLATLQLKCRWGK